MSEAELNELLRAAATGEVSQMHAVEVLAFHVRSLRVELQQATRCCALVKQLLATWDSAAIEASRLALARRNPRD